MHCFRTDVIPLAGAVASLLAIMGQDEFALGNDANILGIVTVWRYDSAFGVRGKQDIAVLRLQFERVERPVKRRKVTQQFRKMRDVSAPSFYAQCARSSTSRSGAIGVTRSGASCPWAPSRRSQSSVARIVSVSGRKVRPAAIARRLSASSIPPTRESLSGIQRGSSVQGLTA